MYPCLFPLLPVPILPPHHPVAVGRLVAPVPVITHPPVLVIAAVVEHPGPLRHLALIDLALRNNHQSFNHDPASVSHCLIHYLIASFLISQLGLNHDGKLCDCDLGRVSRGKI